MPGHCTYDDYDYNPFDDTNNYTSSNGDDANPHATAHSDTTATVPEQADPTEDTEGEQLKRRFPTFPWTNGDNLADEGLTILYKNADNPRTFKGAKFSSIASIKGKLTTVKQEVSYCMWHPLTEWLKTLHWTLVQPTGGKKQLFRRTGQLLYCSLHHGHVQSPVCRRGS